MEEQSKGHIGYSSNGLYEYFVCGQNIYKAHRVQSTPWQYRLILVKGQLINIKE